MKLKALLLLLFTIASAFAQEPPAPNPPRFDVGTIDAGFYINACLGFSYPIPEGWEVNTQVLGTALGAAKHEPGGGLILLLVDQHTKRPFFNRMVLSASDASLLKADTAGFVSQFVHVANAAATRKILKEPYAVQIAGKSFYRTDFSDQHDDTVLYKAFLATKFRGYFLEWTIVAGTQEEVDAAANTLQKLVFHQPDPVCVMGKEESRSGLISGVVSSTPVPPDGVLPKKVRVSQSVSQGLLIRKVQPEYPPAARANGVQGNVVLRAEVDTQGDVADLVVLSGDPLLTQAAMNAVKQWKYKPYLLSGTPVNVETQITVIFALQRR